MEISYQKFFKDVLIVGGANILNSLTGIIFLPLITKTLGVNDYGVWTQFQAVISLILAFAGLGLPYALNRFLAVKKEKIEIQDEFWSLFLVVTVLTIIISLIFIACASFIADMFFEKATDIVILIGLVVFIVSLSNVFLNLFRSFRQMKTYATFSIINAYGQVGLIAILVLNGFGIWGMIGAYLVVNLAILIALFIKVTKQIGIAKPHFSKIKEYFIFGLPTVPANVASWVVFSSDRFIISHFLGVSAVGIYSAAYGLGSLPIIILAIMGFVLPSTLSKLYEENKRYELKIILSYSLKYSTMLAIPFCLGIAVLSEPILNILSTSKIATQGQIILVFESLNSFILIFGGIISHILVVVKNTKIIGISWLFGAIANFCLNFIMVPRFGLLGAAISTLLSYSIVQGIQIYFSLKSINIKIDWISITKYIIASLVMCLMVWMIKPNTVSMVLLTVMIAIMLYFTLLIISKGLKKDEIMLFINYKNNV
jgi:O-antigen/teichoic acid export membrane protein